MTRAGSRETAGGCHAPIPCNANAASQISLRLDGLPMIVPRPLGRTLHRLAAGAGRECTFARGLDQNIQHSTFNAQRRSSPSLERWCLRGGTA